MRNSRRGLSAVFGMILMLIAIILPASIYYATTYNYNDSLKTAIALEEERIQEKICLTGLSIRNESGIEYVYTVHVNNTGSITSRIRAIYINEDFLFDPSINDPNLATVNPQNYTIIYFPLNQVRYVPTDVIVVATERGVKSKETMGKLYHGEDSESGSFKYYFGPLLLNFTRFYCTNSTSAGVYNPSTWTPGWSVNIKKTRYMVWNITVTNIDDRDITLNKYSCFTLFPNEGTSNRKAWYIDLPNGIELTIQKNTTINIIYIWDTWEKKTAQQIYSMDCQARVFLTFFGIFHEHDGTTKPYGQTIPFEAIVCR